MIKGKERDKLIEIACKQLEFGREAKRPLLSDWNDYWDLYNNKVMQAFDNVTNIPFPFFANVVDTLFSKIDNSPSVEYKLPNKKLLSDKVKSAFDMERTSMRAGWNRKDRAMKKSALLCGRGVGKVYASSVSNEYQSHFDVVDPYTFIADPKHGHLDEGEFHGDCGIFKTKHDLERGAEIGFYDKAAVKKLFPNLTEDTGNSQEEQAKKARLQALDMVVNDTSFVGQKGVMLTEWIMRYNGTKYYLLFDPTTRCAVRCEELQDVFDNDKSPYVSWATHYDENVFWTKSVGSDAYPVAEAARIILSNAIENEKRRTRPMRIVEGGAFVDVNEIMDYVPDNVIVSNPGRQPNIIDIQTPQVNASLNVAQYLDNTMNNLIGIVGQGVNEKDAKVGVFYGQLQQEADRIGIINKAYSEAYAEMGYRFFWGLKQHLTGNKPVELLGKGGVRLEELKTVELKKRVRAVLPATRWPQRTLLQ